jgi:hypothetical protein
MKSPTLLKIANGDFKVSELYAQAVAWESLRASYFTARNQPEAAMDATARAAHYQAALDAMPERAHRYAPPQSDRRWT